MHMGGASKKECIYIGGAKTVSNYYRKEQMSLTKEIRKC